MANRRVSRMSRSSFRSLRLESMEPRQMMAGDAGSTLATAADLGDLENPQSLQGRVSAFDQRDVFRFEISRPGAVEIDLGSLRRNADLFLADEQGNILETSQNRSRQNDSLDVFLDAGVYFAGVDSRSWWGTSYRLDISATLVDATNDPDPSNDSGSNNDPAAPSGSGAGNLPAALTDVSYFGGSRDWNINAVNAPESWNAGYTGEGVVVAVVDTGVDLDHPDLAGSIFVNAGEIAGDGIDNDGNGYVDDVHGYDFAARDADPNDISGHGTHVAGTIAAANNGFGATGIAPGATILPVRVLGDNGSGSSNAVAAGIRYAADLGADIINLSLGGGYSRAIDTAIDYARGLGSLIVAAAGNESASVPGFPARFSASDSNVISVGAHSQSNRIAGFSNDVGNSGSVQIDAPGAGVYSTYVGGRYATLSGTSMASPHVAAVAALALSANPSLDPAQLRSLLVSGVIDAASGSDGLGRLNAATTVAYAAQGLDVSTDVRTALSQTAATRDSSVGRFRSTGFVQTTEFGGAVIDVIAESKSGEDAASDSTEDLERKIVTPSKQRPAFSTENVDQYFVAQAVESVTDSDSDEVVESEEHVSWLTLVV